MKACILENPAEISTRPLVCTDVPLPTAGSGEILLRVRCCGVCRTDLHVVEGELPMRKSPVIPGHQVIGTVAESPVGVEGFEIGDRVGVAWLQKTCGNCRFCRGQRENLCENAEFTGWSRDGGYAEFVSVPPVFAYPVPDAFDDTGAAPLLCAGIIGYRALKLTGLKTGDWSGSRLGIYGFGAAGHVCIQLARFRGADVFVATRDREKHQSLAEELGAKWVGDTFDIPPEKLDASIIFAPAGEIVPAALKGLEKGGTLVLGGIHMSPIPEFKYELIYGERLVRSVANNTRKDGREFLQEAAMANVKTSVTTFPLEAANEALSALKNDGIRGAAVLETGWRGN